MRIWWRILLPPFLFLCLYNVYLHSVVNTERQPSYKRTDSVMNKPITTTEAITEGRQPFQEYYSKHSSDNIKTFYNYSLNKEICLGDVFMLVVVFTVASHINERQTIRRTWGNISSFPDVVLVFLIGNHDNKPSLFEESNVNKDIIEASFVDSYRNLTLKSIAMLEVANIFCKGAKYVMKIDEDVFVKIPVMLTLLHDKKPENRIIGYQFSNKRLLVKRHRSQHKWYVSYSEYSPEYWPTYVNGPMYVISGDIIQRLLQVALTIPLVHIEDVFITGICREKVGAEILNIKHMICISASKHIFRRWKLCDHLPIAINELNYNDTEHIWNTMKKNCSKEEHGLQ